MHSSDVCDESYCSLGVLHTSCVFRSTVSIGVNTRSNTIPIIMRLEIVETKTGYGVKKQESFHANMNTMMEIECPCLRTSSPQGGREHFIADIMTKSSSARVISK